MPNRIIKETICTSEDIALLSPGAEILFYRLIVKADDFGAYYGNEMIVKNTCFPLKSNDIKVSQVISWIEELAKVGLIYYYSNQEGKKYIQLSKWAKHQQIRAKKSKFPLFDDTCNQLISSDSNSLRNPIQSNPIQSYNRSKTDARSVCDFFEDLWSMYPKKRGKSSVTKKALKEIKEAGFETLKKAIERYKDEVKDRDLQYVKNGSSFFNGAWKDYVDEPEQEQQTFFRQVPRTIDTIGEDESY